MCIYRDFASIKYHIPSRSYNNFFTK